MGVVPLLVTVRVAAAVGLLPPAGTPARAAPPPAATRAAVTAAMPMVRLRRVRRRIWGPSKSGASVEFANRFMAVISSSSKGVQPEGRTSPYEVIGFLPCAAVMKGRSVRGAGL